MDDGSADAAYKWGVGAGTHTYTRTNSHPKSHFKSNADPYPIKFIYNVSQIMLCAYMTIEAGLLAYRNGYTFLPCVGYSQKNPPVAQLLWLFYISKVWDFWDTAFIIMGKKWRQLSFLHVYHHLTIFLFYWLNSQVNVSAIFLSFGLSCVRSLGPNQQNNSRTLFF
jgi:hypothetical protein